MRKTLLACAILTLSACAATPAQIVYDLRSGLDAALAGAVAYASLPACPAASPCADHDVVVQIDRAAHTAIDAMDAAETTVRAHPDLDASAAIDAAANAVGALRKILTTYGIL